MPFIMFGTIIEDYPRTALIAVALSVALGVWFGIDMATEKQAADAKFSEYMARCLERNSEAQCIAYFRWNRQDLGER